MSGAPRIAGPPPIGVFDSGVGGLTVLRALREALPAQDFIYLGDTARLPYGTKSPETVARYSLQCAAALLERGIGSLVVACNTASASALGALRERYPALPVIGVIEPGAEAAVAASASQHIAVIGTEGTIRGGAYQTAIHRRSPEARVTSCACSMFVALAEEGWTQGPVAEAVAHRYLDPIFDVADSPDCLVLGCTHFPALIDAIRSRTNAATPGRVCGSSDLGEGRRPRKPSRGEWRRELEPARGHATGDRIEEIRPRGTMTSSQVGRRQGNATSRACRRSRFPSAKALRAEAVEIIDL